MLKCWLNFRMHTTELRYLDEKDDEIKQFMELVKYHKHFNIIF